MSETILWRRLDVPGHDACRLERGVDGWQVDGTAIFREDGLLARLEYRVECDFEWVSRQGHVRGWLGAKPVDLTLARTAEGVWTLNGAVTPGLESCADLDLGFTPATNTLQIRRLALVVGRSAPAPVAWLDVAAGSLALLQQRYERRSETTYWYESPRFNYEALLEVTPAGFVRLYPGLWEMELAGGS
jgi:uncharacterized protein